MGMSVFENHKISESINKDFDQLFKSQEMKRFEIGLQYKSQKTRQTDEALVNLLIERLKMYKNGWVMANALQTAELYKKAETIDEVFALIYNFNDVLNMLLRQLKELGILKGEKLEALREIESQLKKLK